ncbi:hypothetical protein LCGC14_3082770, partial [marine sediment metagenome]
AVEAANPLWMVLRYVERNALRAKLVRRAQAWRWSSLYWWRRPAEDRPLRIEPVRRPEDWLELVNVPLTDEELTALRRSVNRGRPLGADRWVRRVASQLALEHTLRPRGRPRKGPEK